MAFLTKLLTFIKVNFSFLVIAMLVCIVMLQNYIREDLAPVVTNVTKSTEYVPIKGEVIRIPPIIKVIPGEKEIEYIPNPNYDKLVLQYNKLVNKHTVNNVYRDSIKIDSIGFVYINDTVAKNKIKGRKISYSLKYPIVTNTITLPPKRNTQVYYGGGLSGDAVTPLKFANVGLLLKTKNDHIYNVYGGVSAVGTTQVGIQAYWKIKLRND